MPTSAMSSEAASDVGDRVAVERRSGAAGGGEHLVEHRHVHRAGDGTVRVDGTPTDVHHVGRS